MIVIMAITMILMLVMMMIKLNKRLCAFKPDPPIHLLVAACTQRFPMMTLMTMMMTMMMVTTMMMVMTTMMMVRVVTWWGDY